MAAHIYAERKTLDPENQFSFVCPVFKATTKIAGCFMLRDLWAIGERPETRRGCSVALDAGKCPIDHILQSMRLKNDDPYHSKEAKVGSLREEILERISPVLVPEKWIERARVPSKEAELLLKGNDDARAGVKIKLKKTRRRDPTPTEMETPAPAPATADTTEAAKTGDMTAAINAEITGETP